MAFVKDDGPCTKCQALKVGIFFFSLSFFLPWVPGKEVWCWVERNILYSSPRDAKLLNQLETESDSDIQISAVTQFIMVFIHWCCLKMLVIYFNKSHKNRVNINILWTYSLNLDLYWVTLQVVETMNFPVLTTRNYPQSKHPQFVQLF